MFVEFEEYIQQYHKELEERYLHALKVHEIFNQAMKELREASTVDMISIIPEEYKKHFRNYCCWRGSSNASYVIRDGIIAIYDIYTHNDKTYIKPLAAECIEEGKYGTWHASYQASKNILSALDDKAHFIVDNGSTVQDFNYVENRDEKWCIERAAKDADSHRRAIEQRVRKYIGEVIKVDKCPGDGWYLLGDSGNKCHMYFIEAGGYNIQCLHIRCIVKPVK